MLGHLGQGHATVGALKSRRAMLDTLVKHLDMVRLSARGTFVLAALGFALAGCNGLIDGNRGMTETLTPEEVAAREAFVNKAKTVLDQNCGACHSGNMAGIGFMAGADAETERSTLLGFDPQVVNLDAPASSRILTKGGHSGPALTAQQSADLLDWINAERDAAGATGTVDVGLETAAFTPVLCTSGVAGDPTCPYNTVDISGLVPGWAGAKIRFVARPLSQDLYVTNLELSGSTDGVYLEHPLFVSWPPQTGDTPVDPIPDTLDRFFNVKMDLMPGAMPQQIGGGTAAFIHFTPTNQLTIHFKAVDKYRPDTGGTGTGSGGGTVTATGCKQVPSFVTNARGPLQTNCSSCHANAGNANAIAAMDIQGVANSTDMATMQKVCDQVRTRINFQDTNSSGFYIAPNPADATGHPFKFGTQAGFDSFKTAVDPWVQAEKTSP